MATRPEVDAIEIRLVLEAIRARYGYDFREYDDAATRRRVLAAYAKSGARNLGDFIHELLTSPERFAMVLDEMTIRVSEMFRDPPFFLRFREEVVPVLRTYPQIKIWHAGCAMGQEAYATAIVLLEEGIYHRAQIYSTDVSARALTNAREGVYPEDVFTKYEDNYRRSGGKARLSDYCSRGYGHFAIRDSLRENMVFFQHDLVSDYALGEMHAIFCRNVLIYFGQELRRKVLAMLRGSLCHGGFLCLGSSESLPATAQPGLGPFATSDRIYRRRQES